MSKAVQKVEIAPPPAATEGAALLSMLERMARDPSVDPARIQQFLQMKRDDEDRVARRSFLAAFSGLQGQLPPVARRGTAHNNKKYARFEDIIEAIRPVLLAHGFTLSFRTDQQDGSVKVTGVLGHKDGHEERTSIVLPMDKTGNKNDVQAWGSSTSYGKRYVSLTLLGIATEDEDDDGRKAGAPPVERVSDDDLAAIKKLIEKAGLEEQVIKDTYHVATLEELTATQAQSAVKKLNKTIEFKQA